MIEKKFGKPQEAAVTPRVIIAQGINRGEASRREISILPLDLSQPLWGCPGESHHPPPPTHPRLLEAHQERHRHPRVRIELGLRDSC